MKAASLLAAERVVVPLAERSLTGATRALVDRLTTVGAVADSERLRGRIDEDRAEAVVSLPERAFLVHYRTDAVRELVVALGIAAQPVRRDAGEAAATESAEARVVFLLLAPPRDTARYLQVLSAFARLLARPDVIEQLTAAESADVAATLPAFAQMEVPEQLTVRDIMMERPRTSTPDTALRDAARDLVRYGLDALPVLDRDGLLVGMLSERELLRHLLHAYLQSGARRPGPGSNAEHTVRDVMTRQVLCVSPEQPLAEVASLMTNKDVDRVPVVREGRLVGLLTRGDIVRKLIGR